MSPCSIKVNLFKKNTDPKHFNFSILIYVEIDITLTIYLSKQLPVHTHLL